MSGVNDLAIVMAKRIHSAVQEIAIKTAKNESDSMSIAYPNFYNLREEILNVLIEYMDELHFSESVNPLEQRMLTPQQIEIIKNQKLRYQACSMVEKIFESPDHFNKFEYKDDWSPLETTSRSIVVLKSAKLYKESRK